MLIMLRLRNPLSEGGISFLGSNENVPLLMETATNRKGLRAAYNPEATLCLLFAGTTSDSLYLHVDAAACLAFSYHHEF